MSTHTTTYPLRAPAVAVPGHSKLVRRVLIVSGLAASSLLLLLAVFDLEARQALPIAVLLGLTGQRFVELALTRRHDLFEPVNAVAAYFILYFAFRAVYVLGYPSATRIGYFSYDDYLPAALWCASLGYFAFSTGYYSNIARRILTHL